MVKNFCSQMSPSWFPPQDRNAGSRADGRHWENHDAEWRHVWHIHGHWNGDPLLTRAMAPHYSYTSHQSQRVYNKIIFD